MENKQAYRTRKTLWYALLLAGLTYYLGSRYHYAPDASLSTLRFSDDKGQELSISDFAGKPLFINFYASWCGPCMAEMPSLNEAAITLADVIVFIGLTDDAHSEIGRTRDHFDLHFKVFKLDGGLRSNGVPSIPTSYLLDEQGKVVYSKSGGADWSDASTLDELRQSLQSAY